ncbi:recombination regulator RecX [Pseudonocardia sp. K10HN5]|uniref:Regulatory protein RecX n=2 Tax=Pseudonocardia acidicola TaxID=2724939 RepID=A0ABX1S520_9PSEU|nr:recombination regulator RecX [Pseudonocardia acidicola]NMH96014.1 recombination regulator RecX [Pseudonocardia acidicola]
MPDAGDAPTTDRRRSPAGGRARRAGAAGREGSGDRPVGADAESDSLNGGGVVSRAAAPGDDRPAGGRRRQRRSGVDADGPDGGPARGRPGARGRTGWGAAERDDDADPDSVARSICLRLLTDRARTRQELAQALRKRGVPDDAAARVLDRFGEVGLIDDAAFAGQWVRSRHTFRGLGRRAIAIELRRKGVDDETAGEALAEVDQEAEEQRARELVDRKLRTQRGEVDEAVARRLLGMLARKGYPAGVAYRAVREALAEHAAELAEQLPSGDED